MMNDYTKFSKPPVVNNEVLEEIQNPVVEEEVIEEPIREESNNISGVVSGCKKLNVREQPDFNAEVVCVISEGSEVVVVMNENHGDFYKVCTAAGMEGYCMKKFISVN